ncbi:MAG: RNA polymerase subunit sigma-70 [Oscillospiraceae bacterium]|nr:RNA polymerase subunit sigma-70 [Oscillospiraceae bacterium]
MTATQKQQIATLRAQGRGYADIALLTGLAAGNIKTYCYRHGILPAAPADSVTKPNCCQQCGAAIEQTEKQKPRKFCCDKCREAWWNHNRVAVRRDSVVTSRCAFCGAEFEKLSHSTKKFCSHQHYIFSRFGAPS